MDTRHSLSRGFVSCALHCSLPAVKSQTGYSGCLQQRNSKPHSHIHVCSNASPILVESLLPHAEQAKQIGLRYSNVSEYSNVSKSSYTSSQMKHSVSRMGETHAAEDVQLTSSPNIAACRFSNAACMPFNLRCRVLAATSCAGMFSAIGETMSASLSRPPSSNSQHLQLAQATCPQLDQYQIFGICMQNLALQPGHVYRYSLQNVYS